MIIGVDPGLHGAVAIYRSDKDFGVFDMPTFELVRNGKKKHELDPHTLARLLTPYRLATAWLEQVNSMPGQGVSSVFSFGKSYGIVIGVLATLGIPYNFVTPQVWKKAMQVPAAKDAARARASQLLPLHANKWNRVKDDGRAESALIALYGFRQS